MSSLLHPLAPVRSGFANAVRLMRHAGLLAGAVFCPAPSVRAEVTFDSTGLDLPDVKAINNQPISKLTRGTIHNGHIKPSFDCRDDDGMQVEEYRFQEDQAPGIHVKLGMGTSYDLNKPKDSSSCIRERGDIDRVPSISVLKF